MIRKTLIVIAIGSCGLSCESLTAPTNVHNPRELLIETYTKCYAAHHEIGKVDVRFQDEKYIVPYDNPSALSPDMKLLNLPSWVRVPVKRAPAVVLVGPAAGWTHPLSDLVTYWRPWVHEATNDSLAWVASHEVCHLTGIRDEKSTNACNEKNFWVAGCYR